MADRGFALFNTAIGRCGIAWNGRRVAAIQLPGARVAETRSRLRQRVPDAREQTPPAAVRHVIDDIVALMRGNPRDLRAVPLDMQGIPPFSRLVYETARSIGPGMTTTYGEIAARAGTAGAARAVGQALGRNPFAIVVPCHRVLAAGGRPGGFSADGGLTTKLRMLRIEGASARENGELFDDDSAAPRAGRSLARRPRATPDVGAGKRAAGLDYDPRVAVEHLRVADARLARVMHSVGPFTLQLQKTPGLFGALAEAIVYQQLTGKAAQTIFGRVRALFPRTKGGPRPADILGARDDDLRGAGLSRAKLLALKDLAARAEAGEIPTLVQARRTPDDALVEQLTKVRGIGRWTVEMLLIFRLGRPDVLPADDYGIRKGFAAAFGLRELPGRKQIETRGARWTPYRTVASWYLWRAAERVAKRSAKT